MTSYLLIKALLICGLGVIAWILLSKPRTASRLAMRRLGMLVLILFACFAVLSPNSLNRLAEFLEIEAGLNLLVYGLALALFAEMASSYRRDVDAEVRLTRLARAVALARADRPIEETVARSSEFESPRDTIADDEQARTR